MELVSHMFRTRELLIMPVGDIQFSGDDAETAMGMLKRHIAWGVEHGAWFIGMGDYVDTFSPSNRERLGGARLYDTAVKALDRDAEKRVRELYAKALKPSRGRWLGLLEGHHYHEFRNQTTSDQLLADLLQAPFLGTQAYVRLVFRRGSAGTSAGSVMLWCHHGAGSSSTAGGALNRLERVTKGYRADVYMMGHQHSKDGKPLDILEASFPPNGRPYLVHRTRLLVVTGSFLKGIVAGRRDGLVPRGGYVEKGMMNPVSLGGVLVRVRPRWKDAQGEHYWSPDLGVEL